MRVRVVDNESFLPQVANYNRSIQFIAPASQYCKIVQADDWIFPDCIRAMVSLAEHHSSIGIVEAYRIKGAPSREAAFPITRHSCRVERLAVGICWTIFSGLVCRLLYCFGVRSSAAETRSTVRADSMQIPRPAIRFSLIATLSLSVRCFPMQEPRMNR